MLGDGLVAGVGRCGRVAESHVQTSLICPVRANARQNFLSYLMIIQVRNEIMTSAFLNLYSLYRSRVSGIGEHYAKPCLDSKPKYILLQLGTHRSCHFIALNLSNLVVVSPQTP